VPWPSNGQGLYNFNGRLFMTPFAIVILFNEPFPREMSFFFFLASYKKIINKGIRIEEKKDYGRFYHPDNNAPLQT
jgi:hypothetical protein